MSRLKFDVDFSLGLHNRTGKFYIARDILDGHSDLFDQIYYWRISASHPPTGLVAKILGKGLAIEQNWRVAHSAPRAFRQSSRKPVLHLDPHTVLNWSLTPEHIVLCHDVGPVTHPELFKPSVCRLYEEAYKQIALIRPRMVFVSQASRDAFADLWGAWPNMQVVYPPIRADVAAGYTQPVDGVSSRFLLCVGSIGDRKNQAGLIEAFHSSKAHETGMSLILCGKREPGAEHVETLAAQTPGVNVLPYVDDAALRWLYQNAVGFALPSRLEGFGVPVAEAIAHGLIPIVSRHTVLEEVAGDGALLVDPDDREQVSVAIRRLSQMVKSEREDRRTRLKQSIARFTPDRFHRSWREVLEGSHQKS